MQSSRPNGNQLGQYHAQVCEANAKSFTKHHDCMFRQLAVDTAIKAGKDGADPKAIAGSVVDLSYVNPCVYV